jgi:hypothetical protein
MQDSKFMGRAPAVRTAWRALDFVVSALFVDTIEYPKEYERAREITR